MELIDGSSELALVWLVIYTTVTLRLYLDLT